MSGHQILEVQGPDLAQGLDPITGIGTEAVGRGQDHEIAGDHDLLFGQVHHRVAAGIALAEVEDLDRPLAPVQGQVVAERQGRRRGLETIDVLQHQGVSFHHLPVPALGLLVHVRPIPILSPLQRLFHCLHLSRQSPGHLLHIVHRRPGDVFSGVGVADDLDVGEGLSISLIPQMVIAVPVTVDDIAHRFVGELADLGDDVLGRQGHAPSLEHDDVPIVDHDGGVPLHRCPN